MSALSRRAFLGGVAAAAVAAKLPIPAPQREVPAGAIAGATLKAGDVFTIAGVYSSRWDVMWGERPLQQFRVVA